MIVAAAVAAYMLLGIVSAGLAHRCIPVAGEEEAGTMIAFACIWWPLFWAFAAVIWTCVHLWRWSSGETS